MASTKDHLKITTDDVDEIIASVESLTKNQVLVGVPATNAGRDDPSENNAALAYIHNFGSPAQNIPAREFMFSGLEGVRDQMVPALRTAALGALRGNREASIKALHRIGTIARLGIQKKIMSGPFQPLSERTLKGRLSNRNKRKAGIRKGAAKELANRAAGWAPTDYVGREMAKIEQSNALARPLVDTGQLRNSIDYVLQGKWF